jgi:hypothetical protein
VCLNELAYVCMDSFYGMFYAFAFALLWIVDMGVLCAFAYVFVDSRYGVFYAFAFVCLDSRYGVCLCVRVRLCG